MTELPLRQSAKHVRLTTADQIVSSLSNLVFVVLVAQSSSPSVFAQISSVWSLISFSVVMSRSVFGVPLILDSEKRPVGKLEMAGSRAGALLIGVPAAITSTVLFGFSDERSSSLSFLLLALCVPMILLQDLGRYFYISRNQSKSALSSDLFLLAPISLAIGISFITPAKMSSNTASTFLLVSLVIALASFRSIEAIKVSNSKFIDLIKNDSDRRKKLFYEALLYAFTAIASIGAIWMAYDSNGAAAFNGSLYALAPIGLTVLVVNLVIQQNISISKGIIHTREYAILGMLLTASIGWMGLIAYLPSSIGVKFFGETWELVRPMILPMGLILILGLVIEFVLTSFRARAQFALVVTVRKIVAAATPATYLLVGWAGYALPTALVVMAIVLVVLIIGLYLRSKSLFPKILSRK